MLFGIYWTWNIYHFGMQNFGVLSLYKRNTPRSVDGRVRDGLLCLGITALGMGLLPYFLREKLTFLLLAQGLSFNHWLVDIGLSSRVARHPWVFIGSLLALGSAGFLWLVPRADHIATKPIMAVIAARWGLGFVHFLYSRWVWRLNDPAVRATIGRDLFLPTN
jgi:hypothetical protein